MIDTNAIELYNKTRAFARKEYHPYDNKELRGLQEAAPLLKFTLHKQTLEIEAKNVQTLLDIGYSLDAEFVIISKSRTQFLLNTNSRSTFSVLAQGSFGRYFKTTKDYYEVCKDRMIDLSMSNYWSRYAGALMDGSTRGGMYVSVGPNKYKHIKTANAIIRKLYENGYIAVRGRTPTASDPTKFGMFDVQELEKMLDFCTTERMQGLWMRQLAKQFARTVKDYRWPTRSDLELKIKKFLKR